MALARIDAFGPPTYGPLHGTEGIVFHTPENSDPSVEAAVATAAWQATAGNSSGGSYHGILGHDDALGPMSDPDAWILVKTVPFSQIAGSISTRRDAVWAPDRYPWLRQLLSTAAYADPNAYLHALCLGGRAAWWSDKLSTAAGRAQVAGAIITLARWTLRLEAAFSYDAVLTLHRHWQTNRSDPGPLTFTDRVLDAYAKLAAPAPAPAPDVATVEELSVTVARQRRRLALKDEALAAADTALGATIATLRAARVKVQAGKEA